MIMNVGLPATREKFLKDGLGVLIKPFNDDAKADLAQSWTENGYYT